MAALRLLLGRTRNAAFSQIHAAARQTDVSGVCLSVCGRCGQASVHQRSAASQQRFFSLSPLPSSGRNSRKSTHLRCCISWLHPSQIPLLGHLRQAVRSPRSAKASRSLLRSRPTWVPKDSPTWYAATRPRRPANTMLSRRVVHSQENCAVGTLCGTAGAYCSPPAHQPTTPTTPPPPNPPTPPPRPETPVHLAQTGG